MEGEERFVQDFGGTDGKRQPKNLGLYVTIITYLLHGAESFLRS